MRFRQAAAVVTAFVLVVGGLAWFDPRVRDWFSPMISGGDGIMSWDNRAMDYGGALVVVAALLQGSRTDRCWFLRSSVPCSFVFMVRT